MECSFVRELVNYHTTSNCDKGCGRNYKIVLTSSKNYIRIVSIEVKQLSSEAGAEAWQQFVNADQQNVLLDFSYAGYKYGEMAPPEIETLTAARI